MAETLTVKSPSLFLTPSDKGPARGSKPGQVRSSPQRPPGKEPLKAASADPNGVVKRKQTKSRNGAYRLLKFPTSASTCSKQEIMVGCVFVPLSCLMADG